MPDPVELISPNASESNLSTSVESVDILRLRELESAANKPPWVVDSDGDIAIRSSDPYEGMTYIEAASPADIELITAMRNNMLPLLDRLESAESELAEARSIRHGDPHMFGAVLGFELGEAERIRERDRLRHLVEVLRRSRQLWRERADKAEERWNDTELRLDREMEAFDDIDALMIDAHKLIAWLTANRDWHQQRAAQTYRSHQLDVELERSRRMGAWGAADYQETRAEAAEAKLSAVRERVERELQDPCRDEYTREVTLTDVLDILDGTARVDG